MEEVHFQVFVDDDGVIRPPAGVSIPCGEVMVTVRAVAITPAEPEEGEDVMAQARAWLLAMAAEAEAIDEPLPDDMARNHDHYAHGAPRR